MEVRFSPRGSLMTANFLPQDWIFIGFCVIKSSMCSDDHQVLKYPPSESTMMQMMLMVYFTTWMTLLTGISAFDDPKCDSHWVTE